MVADHEGGRHQGELTPGGAKHGSPASCTMIIYLTGTEWDEFGRLVLAVGIVAMLAYLAPEMMSLSPKWARRMQIAAITFLTIALGLAAIATGAWFLR